MKRVAILACRRARVLAAACAAARCETGRTPPTETAAATALKAKGRIRLLGAEVPPGTQQAAHLDQRHGDGRVRRAGAGDRAQWQRSGAGAVSDCSGAWRRAERHRGDAARAQGHRSRGAERRGDRRADRQHPGFLSRHALPARPSRSESLLSRQPARQRRHAHGAFVLHRRREELLGSDRSAHGLAESHQSAAGARRSAHAASPAHDASARRAQSCSTASASAARCVARRRRPASRL